MKRLFLSCSVAALFACSPAPEKSDPPAIIISGDSGNGGGTDAGTVGEDGGATTSDDVGADAAVEEPVRLSCVRGCSTATDCSENSPELYECVSGVCSYVGCLGDGATCPQDFACVPSESTPYRGDCLSTCEVDADCSQAACIEGTCRANGCANDAQCAERGDEYSLCTDTGGGIKTCVNPCETAADCDPDFPAELTCGEEGWCLVAECESDAECGEWWDWDTPRCVRWDYEARTIEDD